MKHIVIGDYGRSLRVENALLIVWEKNTSKK